MAILCGFGLCRREGSSPRGLDSPHAALFAASLAFSLGSKLVWPETQCMVSLHIPLVLAARGWLFHHAS